MLSFFTAFPILKNIFIPIRRKRSGFSPAPSDISTKGNYVCPTPEWYPEKQLLVLYDTFDAMPGYVIMLNIFCCKNKDVLNHMNTIPLKFKIVTDNNTDIFIYQTMILNTMHRHLAGMNTIGYGLFADLLSVEIENKPSPPSISYSS